jgi:hypothetical protein
VSRLRKITGLFLLIALAAVSAWAVEGWDLTSSEVRQAYFLGQRRGDQQLNDFLASYEKRLSAAPGGFRVWSVAVSTPYSQIVERSRRYPAYSSQQAQRDYDNQRDRIVITATVYFPTGAVYSFGGYRIWNDFDLTLVQNGRSISPHQVQREPLYSFGQDGALTGFLLRAEFSTHQLSRGPVRVEVLTHERQTVSADFDLARLK